MIRYSKFVIQQQVLYMYQDYSNKKISRKICTVEPRYKEVGYNKTLL